MKKIVYLTALAVSAISLFAAGHGQEMKRGQGYPMEMMQNHGRMEGHCGDVLKDLNLTADQATKLQTIRTEMQTKMKALLPTQPVNPLVKYIAGGNFDTQTFSTDMMTLETSKIQLKASMLEQTYNILTAEQKTKLSTLTTSATPTACPFR